MKKDNMLKGQICDSLGRIIFENSARGNRFERNWDNKPGATKARYRRAAFYALAHLRRIRWLKPNK